MKKGKEVKLNVDQALNELKVNGLLRKVFEKEFKETLVTKTEWKALLKKEGYNV